MIYIIPIIDLNSDNKYLKQAILNIVSLRKCNTEDRVILYDSTISRSVESVGVIDKSKEDLNYEYINDIYYDSEYWKSNVYGKLMGNRQWAICYGLDTLEEPFIVIESDIIWLQKLIFNETYKDKDILTHYWNNVNGKQMVSDHLLLFNINENTKDFGHLYRVMYKGLLYNKDLNYFVKYISRENGSNKNMTLNSESGFEITLNTFKNIKIDDVRKYCTNMDNSYFHYAHYKTNREDVIKPMRFDKMRSYFYDFNYLDVL